MLKLNTRVFLNKSHRVITCYLQFAASVLETRLNEVLRFTLGRTYGVSVHESFNCAPPMLSPQQPMPGIVTVSVFCCRGALYSPEACPSVSES